VVAGDSKEPFGIGIDSVEKVRKAVSANIPTMVAAERMITQHCAFGRASAQADGRI
jgi:hypothetical protein